MSEQKTQPLKNEPLQSGRRAAESRLLIAALVLLLINMVALTVQPVKVDRSKHPFRGWISWIWEDLDRRADGFNTAILGSSLIVEATGRCDATYLKKPLRLTDHHRASYFEHLLKQKFGGLQKSVNLSAPGLMASDGYLMLKGYVERFQHPDLLVYAVAPRDFLDATVDMPGHTMLFHELKRLTSTEDIDHLAFMTPVSRLDRALEGAVYLYGASADLSMKLKQTSQGIIDALAPRPADGHFFGWKDRRRVLPQYRLAEVHPDMTLYEPAVEGARRFVDNSGEYRERYGRFDERQFEAQVECFRHTLQFCDHNGIRLVIVNMPITEANKKLLPSGFEKRYKTMLQESCHQWAVPYFDFDDGGFNRDQFEDTVHLNARGGKDFYDRLAQSLSHNPELALHLIDSGKRALAGSVKQSY